MKRAVSTKIYAAFLAVIILVSVASGTAYWLLTKAEEPNWIWGDVIFDKPLIGAAITVFDSDGNKLYEEKNATYTTGAFLLEVSKIPEEFLIVAEGGTLNNESFAGKVTRPRLIDTTKMSITG